MNIAQANAIPIAEILAKFNIVPVRETAIDAWYFSPFRSERTASFHVNTVKNVWYDFGSGRGGKAIDFVMAWLEHSGEDKTVVDALRWLRNMMFKPTPIVVFPKPKDADAEAGAALTLQMVAPLQNKTLIAYLELRGIPQAIASKYLKEVFVKNSNTGKNFFAIGMRNEDNGYELRNMFFKGSLSPKHISFIRGENTSCGEINVFEGWTDFLSALAHQKDNRFEGDTIVLNSLSCVSKAMPYIEACPYTKLRTWLDNDMAGESATRAFNRFAVMRGNIEFEAMNRVYSPHKDVNAWHIQKPKSPQPKPPQP